MCSAATLASVSKGTTRTILSGGCRSDARKEAGPLPMDSPITPTGVRGNRARRIRYASDAAPSIASFDGRPARRP